MAKAGHRKPEIAPGLEAQLGAGHPCIPWAIPGCGRTEGTANTATRATATATPLATSSPVPKPAGRAEHGDAERGAQLVGGGHEARGQPGVLVGDVGHGRDRHGHEDHAEAEAQQQVAGEQVGGVAGVRRARR